MVDEKRNHSKGNDKYQSQKLVKSASRTLEIIELLAVSQGGMILRDISQRLEIPISSAHGLINTLVHWGYVIKDAGTSRYKLGIRLHQIIASYQADSSLISLADPIMKKLRSYTDETACLSVIQNDSIILIHKKATANTIQVVNALGSQLPAHATASGKAMLAFFSNDEINHIFPNETLKKYTPSTIISKKELIQILKKVRIDNYAIENEETETGVWAVGSCIRNVDSRPIAALSIVAPSYRVTNNYLETFPRLIIESTKQISIALGFTNKNR